MSFELGTFSKDNLMIVIYNDADKFCKHQVTKAYITNPLVGQIENEKQVSSKEMLIKRKDYNPVLMYENSFRGAKSIKNYLGFIMYKYVSGEFTWM